MHQDIKEILFTQDAIQNRIAALGAEITEEYRGSNLTLMALLKGGVVFISDLMRNIPIHLEIDFIVASSYGDGTESSGNVKLKVFPQADFSNQRILLLDDILDTGNTLSSVVAELERRGAQDVRTCVLLDKAARRSVDITADHIGFSVEDQFVVGYGLDFADRYRNLPFIGVLKEECYETQDDA